MDLPDLSIDHVLSTVLKTLTDYDRKTQQRTTINLSEEANDDTAMAQNTRTGEYLHDPVTDGSQDLDPDSDHEEYYATSSREPATDTDAQAPKKVTAPTQDSTIPKKAPKPSCFPKCESLLRFLWTAAFQLKFPTVEPQLPSAPVLLTVDPSLLDWSNVKELRNRWHPDFLRGPIRRYILLAPAKRERTTSDTHD
jgi:hypothetical protein